MEFTSSDFKQRSNCLYRNTRIAYTEACFCMGDNEYQMRIKSDSEKSEIYNENIVFLFDLICYGSYF